VRGALIVVTSPGAHRVIVPADEYLNPAERTIRAQIQGKMAEQIWGAKFGIDLIEGVTDLIDRFRADELVRRGESRFRWVGLSDFLTQLQAAGFRAVYFL
jgi:hypothetical protein